MINDIYVFDDIIEKPYQELIKETLLGGDNPPTVDEVEEAFPWYYTSDITDASHEGPFQGRFGFSHQYVNAEEGVISDFHNLFLGLIKNSCKKINVKKVDVLQGRSFLSTPTNISKDDVDTPHVDMVAPHFIMLYYVCDSDGDTIIYNEKTRFDDCKPDNEMSFTIKKKVSPKQGRVVLFNGIHYHTAEQPNHNLRCIVNYDLRDLSLVRPGVRI
jgi:hypothetical protein